MPGPRLFGKSPVGTIAFLVVSLLIVAVLVGSGRFPHHWALLVGGAVAALVELAPVPPDDNLTIPLAAGGAMHLLGA
jgi:dolichol kinase